ncbi:unnamed protein product [Rotaria magnacalcarata]|nr:unnamed protein product [Rotaria magnacalcarata]CAF3952637.1 unnamed protein product [Rotaria magnacalcarata]CAF4137709.1 unnamed protein product [Rotaria magnacalcarata]
MGIGIFNSIILNVIALVVIYPIKNSATSCSIFLSLNCSCFQSNFDLNFTLPLKTYSHLYCQGNSLNEKTFKSPFGFDFQNQRFRTISIEFFLKNQVEIRSNHFDSLSILYSQTNDDADIELSIRFIGFTHITFNKYSISSNIFQRKHYKKHLWLHFIPITTNNTEIVSGENNLTDSNDQFKFSENCFSGLTVSHLNIYSYTKEDLFSSSFPFEYVFNNTNIGELHFHGSIIPPGPHYLRRIFKGLVRSLTLHRHADTIDSNSFPYYFSVYSYNIYSMEAYSMNLNSFIPLYTNLRGLELIKPHFEVSIDKFIPSLDSLTLDIEQLNERTLLAAQQINNLKLGSRLRRVNFQVLYALENHLKHFDLSDVNLSEMATDSRCHLIDFIHNNYQRQLNIILPRINNLTECDCTRLIIIDIQLNRKSNDYSSDNLLCTKKCRFSDCSVISEYFRKKIPLFTNENQLMNHFNHADHDLPSVDVFSDSMDIDMMHFLVNQTIDRQTNFNRRQSTISPFINVQHSHDSLYSIEEDKNDLSKSRRNKLFSWTSILFGSIAFLLLIIIVSSIIFCLVKPLMNRCREKSSRSAIAAFLLVFLVIVVILPIILIIIALTGSTLDFVANLSNSTTARNAINLLVPPMNKNDHNNSKESSSLNSTNQSFIDFIKGGKNVTFNILERFLIQRDAITDVVQLFGGKALSVLSTVAGATVQFIVGILIFLVSTYTFLLNGVELWTWTVAHGPLSEKHMNRLKNAFQETGRGLLIGVCLTCAVQGIVAAIAYLCLQIPRWYALGVLTGFCSLIPILGTAIVWIPITIGLFIQQAYFKAVIMIVVGVLAIGSVDNLLRPFFSKMGSLQMSTLLLLLTIFGGLELLGAWGALLGPLIVRLATEAIILVREDEDEQEQNEAS